MQNSKLKNEKKKLKNEGLTFNQKEKKKVNSKFYKLTYPALAGGVQHDRGMVLGDQLRHEDGGEP